MMGDGICDDVASSVNCMNDYGDCCKVTIMIFQIFSQFEKKQYVHF